MHSMYSGYMEKAIKYSEKALVQVDRLNGKFQYCEQVLISYHCKLIIDQLLLWILFTVSCTCTQGCH